MFGIRFAARSPIKPTVMKMHLLPLLIVATCFTGVPQDACAQTFGSDRILALEAQTDEYAPFARQRLDTIRDAFGTATANEVAHEIISASNELLMSMDEMFQIRKRQEQADMAFVYAVTALAIDPGAGAIVLPGAIAGKDVTPAYFSALERIRDRSQQLARSEKPQRQLALVERILADVHEFEQTLRL
jgi:hypothetical protein